MQMQGMKWTTYYINKHKTSSDNSSLHLNINLNLNCILLAPALVSAPFQFQLWVEVQSVVETQLNKLEKPN